MAWSIPVIRRTLFAWSFRVLAYLLSLGNGVRLFCAFVVKKFGFKNHTTRKDGFMNRKFAVTLVGIGAVLSASWAVGQEQTAPEQ